MKVTLTVRVNEGEYWDEHRVEKDVSVSSDVVEVVEKSAISALPYFKKLILDAIYERTVIKMQLEDEAAQEEVSHEDQTDAG